MYEYNYLETGSISRVVFLFSPIILPVNNSDMYILNIINVHICLERRTQFSISGDLINMSPDSCDAYNVYYILNNNIYIYLIPYNSHEKNPKFKSHGELILCVYDTI